MMKRIIIYAVVGALLVMSGYLLGTRNRRASETIVQRDTTVVVDTHIVEKPVPVKVVVTDTMYAEVRDTIRMNDTLYVSLPLEKKVYRRDEFYAEVTGYNPSLTRIEVYPKTVYVTEKQRETVRQRNYLSVGTEMLYAESFHSYIYLEYERMLHRNVCFSFRALRDISTGYTGASIGIKAQVGW